MSKNHKDFKKVSGRQNPSKPCSFQKAKPVGRILLAMRPPRLVGQFGLYFGILLLSVFVFDISATQKVSDKNKRTLSKKVRSHTWIVKTALKQFTLTYNRNKVAIQGYMMDLSLQRKKCSAHILDRFNKDMKTFISTHKQGLKKNLTWKKTIETLEIQIDGENYFLKGRSPAGMAFLSLPREITRMKWEEKLNCEKKKKTKGSKKTSQQSI